MPCMCAQVSSHSVYCDWALASVADNSVIIKAESVYRVKCSLPIVIKAKLQKNPHIGKFCDTLF